jgi:hypothetical protein
MKLLIRQMSLLLAVKNKHKKLHSKKCKADMQNMVQVHIWPKIKAKSAYGSRGRVFIQFSYIARKPVFLKDF